jgi:hypothetical protein
MTADPIVVWEWDADEFHRKVLDLEDRGYVARRETYMVRAEVHPETGIVVHLHTIEMVPSSEPGALPHEPISSCNEIHQGCSFESEHSLHNSDARHSAR